MQLSIKLLGNTVRPWQTKRNKNVSYVRDDKTSKLVNKPRLKKMTEITDEIFEVEMNEKKDRWDLSLQIVFFVYQYEKLQLLQFYYDFLEILIKMEDFQL